MEKIMPKKLLVGMVLLSLLPKAVNFLVRIFTKQEKKLL